MMPPDLSPSARALLDAARDGLAPDAAMLARVRGKVDAAIAGASTTPVVAARSLGARLADLAGIPKLAGLGVVAVVVAIALILAGAVLIRRGGQPAARPSLELAAPPHTEVLAPQLAHEARPPPSPPEPTVAPRAFASLPPVRAPVRAPDVDLAREVEIIDAAMTALRTGNAAAAIQAVRLHRAETDNQGQLAEDADAIEIEALCKLHDRRVVSKLEAFDVRWPESAQRSRLSTNCF